jgi:hypothetical protein
MNQLLEQRTDLSTGSFRNPVSLTAVENSRRTQHS